MHSIRFAIRLWIYRWIYAPLVSFWEDYKHADDSPLPAIPCQICGQTGHVERYCPNARRLL